MPIDTERIMKLLSTLAAEERLQVTITQCVRGGVIAGSMALAGGLVGGPIGLAAGSAIGGCIAAATSKEFSSVVEIIATMHPEQKEVLAQDVRHIMARFNVTDVVILAGMITSNLAIRKSLVDALINHLRTEMQMTIADH